MVRGIDILQYTRHIPNYMRFTRRKDFERITRAVEWDILVVVRMQLACVRVYNTHEADNARENYEIPN